MPRTTDAFKKAQGYRLNFGQYEGQTIDEIASTDKGLLYLDWCVGALEHSQAWRWINVYLSDPGIKRDLENLRS